MSHCSAVKYIKVCCANNKIDNINKMLEGWFGYAMHGNTYKMRKIIMKKYFYSNLSVFKCI